MFRSLLNGALKSSKKDRVRCRVNAVIDSIIQLPYDGSMVFVEWKLSKDGVLPRFRGGYASGTTKAGIVRNGTIKIQHPFSFEYSLPSPKSDHFGTAVNDHLHSYLIVTVHRLGSGSEVENIGEVAIDLIGQRQPDSVSSHLLQKSNSNAVIKLTVSVEPSTTEDRDTTQDPRDNLTTQCCKDCSFSSKSLKARSASAFVEKALASPSKLGGRQRHKHQLSANDVNIVSKLLDELVCPNQNTKNEVLQSRGSL